MPKPVCVACERFMRPKHNGVKAIEGMPIENGALPGRAEPEKWKPYKLWTADEWYCPSCGYRLITGFGLAPNAERHDPGFNSEVNGLIAAGSIVIKDC